MPTPIEITHKYVKYCKEREIHCLCPTCIEFKTDECPSCHECDQDEVNEAADLKTFSSCYRMNAETLHACNDGDRSTLLKYLGFKIKNP